MAKIKNLTARTVTLPTRHTIAPGATLETTNDVLRTPENAAVLGGLAASLQLTVEFDAEALPDMPPVKASIEANPAAVEQAAVNKALAEAAAKEASDQLVAAEAKEQSASAPVQAKK